MPSTPHRRLGAVAIASMLALTALSTDAFAKSSHSRSRAATAAAARAASAAPQGAGAGSYYYPPVGDRNIYSRPISRGNVIDNTAGWGNVGAF
jgi:hypothetical protein